MRPHMYVLNFKFKSKHDVFDLARMAADLMFFPAPTWSTLVAPVPTLYPAAHRAPLAMPARTAPTGIALKHCLWDL